MADDNGYIHIGCVAIPDGLSGSDTARLSLVLSPHWGDDKDPGDGSTKSRDIERWPYTINDLAAKITVYRSSDLKTPQAGVPVGGAGHSFSSDLSPYAGEGAKYDLKQAKDRWQDILQEVYGADTVKRAVRKGADAAKQSANIGKAYPAAELAAQATEFHAEVTKAAAARIAAGLLGMDMAQFGDCAPRPDTLFWLSLHKVINGTDDDAGSHATRLAGYSRSADVDLPAFARSMQQFKEYYDGLGSEPCDDVEDSDLLLGKLAGIMAYPTLAKFLGMIVDVDIPVTLLSVAPGPNPTEFALRVGMDNDVIKSPWIACRYVPASGKIPAYFGPKGSGDAYRDGLLDLTVLTGDKKKKRRFALSTINPGALAQSYVSLSDAQQKADKGGLPRYQPLPFDEKKIDNGARLGLPEHHSCGIVLCDTEPPTVRATGGVLYAEDVVFGYRIDAALGPNVTGDDGWRRWRPLVARQIGYGATIPGEFLRLDQVRNVSHRDDGHVRPGLSQGGVRCEQLFMWSGESLGLPVPDTKAESLPQKQGEPKQLRIPLAAQSGMLPIDLEFSFPPESERRPVPLREGRSYMFGARLCTMNGGGISFDDARTRYTIAETRSSLSIPKGLPILGQQNAGQPADDRAPDAPYAFLRQSKVRAPELLIPCKESLIGAAKPDEECPGESGERLVIRAGVFGTAPTRTQRCIVPPRAAFEQLEQYGSFDSAKDRARPVPAGMFEVDGALKIETVGDNAMFPLAFQKTWGEPKNEKISRGAVLAISSDAPPPVGRYYPDPMARTVGARIKDTAQSAKLDFWGDSLTTAQPIIVELKAGNEIKLQPRTNDPGDTVLDVRGRPSPAFPCFSVQLPRGHSVDLELWPVLDPTGDAACHQAVQRLQADVPNADVAAIMAAAPLSPCVYSRTIRLTHAVERPDPFPKDPISMQAVVVCETAHDPKTPSAAWTAWAKANGAAKTGAWPSQEGGNTTYFVGTLGIHGPTTGAVRCAAEWDDYTRDIVHEEHVPGAGGKTVRKFVKRIPIASHRLFSIAGIDEKAMQLDLLNDDAHALRGLGYSFTNGAARKLRLRTVATSRFTDCYPPDDTDGLRRKDCGKYEAESAPVGSNTAAIWVPCVFQPPKPEIDKVVPVFHWDDRTDRNKKRREIDWARTVSTRVYFKRPWHVSGQGEAVALLFAPDGADPSRTDEFVTKWGADLIHRAGKVATENVPKAAVRNLPFLSDKISLKAADGRIEVLVAQCEPTLDEASGLWYVDVDIDPGNAYFPFVQMALARYQANAVDGFKLSLPQLFWAQIPPRRDIQVKLSGGDLQVTYSGVSYNRGPEGTNPLLKQSTVRMRVMVRPDRDNGTFVRWIPDPRGSAQTVPSKSGSHSNFWTTVLKAHQNLGNCGVLIEEFESLPDENGAVASRPPFFSKIFDLQSFASSQ